MPSYKTKETTKQKADRLLADLNKKSRGRTLITLVIYVVTPIWLLIGTVAMYVGTVLGWLFRPKKFYQALYYYLWSKKKIDAVTRMISEELLIASKKSFQNSTSDSHSSYITEDKPPDRILN